MYGDPPQSGTSLIRGTTNQSKELPNPADGIGLISPQHIPYNKRDGESESVSA